MLNNLLKLIPNFSSHENSYNKSSGMIRYVPIRSKEAGKFTLLADSRALDFLNKTAGLDHESLEKLPEMVLKKCIDLGFAHGEPVHFLLEVQDERNARTSMTIAKLNPPMPVGDLMVTHTVLIYGLELTFEVERFKNAILSFIEQNGHQVTPANKDACLKALPLAIKSKVSMAISHEFVHMFATDEYKPIMSILGLELLELLTDSITLDMHYDHFLKANPTVQSGVADGIGYLTNAVRREHGPKDPPTHLRLMKNASIEIIKKCKSARVKQN